MQNEGHYIIIILAHQFTEKYYYQHILSQLIIYFSNY